MKHKNNDNPYDNKKSCEKNISVKKNKKKKSMGEKQKMKKDKKVTNKKNWSISSENIKWMKSIYWKKYKNELMENRHEKNKSIKKDKTKNKIIWKNTNKRNDKNL